MKRLKTTMSQEAIKRRRYRSYAVLDKAKPSVQIFVVGTDDTHHDIRMASDVLCHRVYDEI
eukprot:CAMPEP_0176148794 /NCGR_PEP_ID=MMETSP0120_2-20121206/75891_1 /TAXON_ID=160619 /ORGANISM="Kryptoperidinium foliaceum, Strain CCMP 1326" /LENGTH=60 /DNA_ID=CAMNT_0017485515 /DNA_START=170 /DNA_END=349 /DNA_ORIENTATION=-